MYFTAHISKDKTRRQSVSRHTEKVASYAFKYGKKAGLENTSAIQAAFHDLGKLCRDFDDYINERNKMRRGEIDHAYAGARYLYELAKKSNDKESISAAKFISRTIISHHGLHDWLDEDGTDYFLKRIGNTQRYEEISGNSAYLADDDKILKQLEKSAKELSAIHEKCRKISQNDDELKTEFLFYSGMTERLMQSILVDADRTDAADFMNNRDGENSAFDDEAYIRNLWNEMDRRLREKYDDFEKSPEEIDKLRCEIAQECLEFANHSVGACQLIVPTGGGKTLSSLRFAVAQCKSFKKDKILYIAPFMSILEQNSDIIREIAGEENLLEHYTDFEQQIQNENELEEYELRAEKWDSPVISTTLVQFLNTIFSDKMPALRRFHRLCNSVVIIDEVQAIPLKCVNLFNLAVNFLSKICGCTVVLCTATQPALDKIEHSVLFDDDKDMVKNYDYYFEKFHRVNIVPKLKTDKYTYEQAADFCSEQAEKSGNLLFVVNTKNAAAEVYTILKEKYKSTDMKVLHLSTGMCPQHRRAVLTEIRERLDREEKTIVVTTQLIEAGVDISFKCVVRSLAGLDNIAQAAGRCNRNGKYPCCDVYVINLKDENLRHLSEIENKQKCTDCIIGKNKYEELLSAEAISDFFEQLYREREAELSYNVNTEGCNTSILNLLSVNYSRKSQLAARRGKPLPTVCQGFQAFKTAGMLFNVIDSPTEGVIAPYNDEAKELILDLNSDISYEEMSEKNRAAQKYTLSLYSNQIERLKKQGCIKYLKCGAMALQEGFYDAEGIGLSINGENPDGIFF